jgi:hypothetical protein
MSFVKSADAALCCALRQFRAWRVCERYGCRTFLLRLKNAEI